MSLQGIIDSAVNIETNRSKLVAQTVSRSGRISAVSRNWTNPYRFTVTPRPIWHLDETVSIRGVSTTVRAMIETIYAADKYTTQTISLTGNDTSGVLTNAGMSWITEYQGSYTNTNNILTSVTGNSASDAAQGTRIFLTLGGTVPATDTVIVKSGDWIRTTTTAVPYRYPYIAQTTVVVPPSATGITGTITSTDTATTITSVSSTTNLRVGQKITESGTNTGSFGGSTYISAISGTTVTIQSTTANTAGSITFDGSSTVVAVPINRGYLAQSGFTYSGSAVAVGFRAARFNVLVAKLPSIRYLPGKFVEFTGDFELIEEIL